MDEDLTIDQIENTPLHIRIAQRLEDKGTRKSWFADKMGKSRGWVTQILNGDIEITPENKAKIEEVLEIKL